MIDMTGSEYARKEPPQIEEECGSAESILNSVRIRSTALMDASSDLSRFRSALGFSPLEDQMSDHEGKSMDESDITFAYVWKGLADVMVGVARNVDEEAECLEFRISHSNGEEAGVRLEGDSNPALDYVREVCFARETLSCSIRKLEMVADRLLLGEARPKGNEKSSALHEPNVSFAEMWGSMPEFLARSAERIENVIAFLSKLLTEEGFAQKMVAEVDPPRSS